MGVEVEAGNPAQQPSTENVDALLEAARYDDLEDLMSLASSGVPLDSKDSQGRTALHMAAANGHLVIVEYLIRNGVDLNAYNVDKNTALHWACLNGHIEVVKNLIMAGADLTILNRYEHSPLDEAVSNGKMAVIDAINEAAANIEMNVDYTGNNDRGTALRSIILEPFAALTPSELRAAVPDDIKIYFPEVLPGRRLTKAGQKKTTVAEMSSRRRVTLSRPRGSKKSTVERAPTPEAPPRAPRKTTAKKGKGIQGSQDLVRQPPPSHARVEAPQRKRSWEGELPENHPDCFRPVFEEGLGGDVVKITDFGIPNAKIAAAIVKGSLLPGDLHAIANVEEPALGDQVCRSLYMAAAYTDRLAATVDLRTAEIRRCKADLKKERDARKADKLKYSKEIEKISTRLATARSEIDAKNAFIDEVKATYVQVVSKYETDLDRDANICEQNAKLVDDFSNLCLSHGEVCPSFGALYEEFLAAHPVADEGEFSKSEVTAEMAKLLGLSLGDLAEVPAASAVVADAPVLDDLAVFSSDGKVMSFVAPVEPGVGMAVTDVQQSASGVVVEGGIPEFEPVLQEIVPPPAA